jgi:hypothetical protein
MGSIFALSFPTTQPRLLESTVSSLFLFDALKKEKHEMQHGKPTAS